MCGLGKEGRILRCPMNARRNERPCEVLWLPDMDLNHDKQIQSLLCYRYTIGQAGAAEDGKPFARRVKPPGAP
jgi:hypothetical protein